jgi:hypothetical protein
MATYLPQQVWGDGPNISDSDRAKYFDEEKGPKSHHDSAWKLKDGYEVRSLGKGEKPSKLNSLTTYTNDFDSLHDEYDANSDRDNYGIFKTYPREESTDSAPPTDTTPEPDTSLETPPNKSTVDSSHLAEARDRVNAWENKSWSGERAHENFNPSDGVYDARNDNSPDSNAVLNAYKKDFADNFSPAESNLTNAFNQTALNQQGGDVPETPSQQQSQQEEDEFLKNASGQNMLSV